MQNQIKPFSVSLKCIVSWIPFFFVKRVKFVLLLGNFSDQFAILEQKTKNKYYTCRSIRYVCMHYSADIKSCKIELLYYWIAVMESSTNSREYKKTTKNFPDLYFFLWGFSSRLFLFGYNA